MKTTVNSVLFAFCGPVYSHWNSILTKLIIVMFVKSFIKCQYLTTDIWFKAQTVKHIFNMDRNSRLYRYCISMYKSPNMYRKSLCIISLNVQINTMISHFIFF